MHTGRIVFAQLMDFLPKHRFHGCVQRYQGDRRVRRFSCLDQFLCMAFAQLTFRESRSWRIDVDFAHELISMARTLYAKEDFGVALDQTAYAFDSSTIDLCLSLFPWARFRRRKAAIKLHTLLDLRGSIPCFVRITEGKIHDVRLSDELPLEAGALYVLDRGYLDFARLYQFTPAFAFFVIRAKSNLDYRRVRRRAVDKSSGVRADQTIRLAGHQSAKDYPDRLRRIRFFDAQRKKKLVFLTNNFLLPALTIAQIYRSRGRVELFFNWIKQHLRIKAFYGASENAVKTQIWIAISVYVLVAIIKKRLGLPRSLHEILQVLSIALFETTPLLAQLRHVEGNPMVFWGGDRRKL